LKTYLEKVVYMLLIWLDRAAGECSGFRSQDWSVWYLCYRLGAAYRSRNRYLWMFEVKSTGGYFDTYNLCFTLSQYGARALPLYQNIPFRCDLIQKGRRPGDRHWYIYLDIHGAQTSQRWNSHLKPWYVVKV